MSRICDTKMKSFNQADLGGDLVAATKGVREVNFHQFISSLRRRHHGGGSYVCLCAVKSVADEVQGRSSTSTTNG